MATVKIYLFSEFSFVKGGWPIEYTAMKARDKTDNALRDVKFSLYSIISKHKTIHKSGRREVEFLFKNTSLNGADLADMRFNK